MVKDKFILDWKPSSELLAEVHDAFDSPMGSKITSPDLNLMRESEAAFIYEGMELLAIESIEQDFQKIVLKLPPNLILVEDEG